MVKAVFDEAPARPAQRLHHRHHRRRHPHQPDRTTRRSPPTTPGSAPSSTGSAADGTVGANKNTAKIVGKNTDLFVQALLRVRLEEVGVDDGQPPPLRPRADRQHLPHRPGDVRRRAPVELPRADGRAGGRRARRNGADQQPVPGRRGLGPPAGRGAADRARARAAPARDRRRRSRRGRRARRPGQHRDADLLLRPRRRAADRRGDRQAQGGDRRDLRQARRGRRAAQHRRGRHDARPALPRADRRRPSRRRAPPPDRHRRRDRLRPAGDRAACSPARAICCPSARCLPTARSPRAPPTSRSARSPSRSRSGRPTCASIAASARSSALTPRSG